MKNKIIRILNNNNIEHIGRGVNVRKGCIAITCPFCGIDDPSTHLNIDLKNGSYFCWRDKNHSGKKFVGLVVKLLGCTYYEAIRVIGNIEESIPQDWNFSSLFKKKGEENEVEESVKSLEFLPEFRDIESRGVALKFWSYIRRRGFDIYDVEKIISKYNLKCCLTGDQSFRIIFPVYMEGKLVTWIGRSIYQDSLLPYLNLSKAKSIIPTYDCLFNYDDCMLGGDILYVVEGVFDLLRIDVSTEKNVKVCCLFTNTMSEKQLLLIHNLSKKFSEVVIFLDKNTVKQANDMVSNLVHLKNIGLEMLPDKFKDPGEMGKEDILKLTGSRIMRMRGGLDEN